jgi:1,4-alpha-glucan branching enzyme
MVKVFKTGKKDRRKVEFLLPGSAGSRIMLAGSFNDWEPELAVMNYDAARGGYTVTLELAPGEYEYKFVRDDEWLPDDGNPNFTANDFGTLNSVVVVE